MPDELMNRLAELITADEPGEGVAAFGRRLREAWVADLESEPFPTGGPR